MKLIKFKQDTVAYIIALAIALAGTTATVVMISSAAESNVSDAVLSSTTIEETTDIVTETYTQVETEETESTTENTTTEPETESECTIEETVEVTTEPETECNPVDDSYDISYSPFDKELLACVIYQEAGGDYVDDNFRRMIGDVVLNRVNDPRFASTIYGVLITPGQYGWDCYSGVNWPARAYSAYEQHAVARAYRIAEELLNGYHSDIYGQGYVWQAEFPQGDYCFQYYNTYFGR